MPEWAEDINAYLVAPFRIIAGMAVFQGAADVVECSDQITTAKGCLVSTVVLSLSGVIVPFLIYKFYQKVVLRFQDWATRKIRE